MRLEIPDFSLVLLVGPSGCGKSTFARRHFRPTEVLSSDFFRGLVADDETDQSCSADAFASLHFVLERRLAAGRLTVVDATNVQPEARRPLVALAKRYHALVVAVVFDLPEEVCLERNRLRPDRDFGPYVVRRQRQDLRRSLPRLDREGIRAVHLLRTPEEVEGATVERRRLWNDRRDDPGPFDIVGDVHGCHQELCDLLEALGWRVAGDGLEAEPPEGRRALFVGDLVDRGPGVAAVLKLVMGLVDRGQALCVPGNHDMKLLRALRGRNVRRTHGLSESLDQLEAEPEDFRGGVAGFLDGLVSHYVLDGGRLVVAHAGLGEDMQGRSSGRVREFCLYGDTTGETDEFGLPVRRDWAARYRGRAAVVYGHTPVAEAEWFNNTINIDTGCVFGGKLTALRWPERELVSVPARRTWYEPSRPLLPPRSQDGGLDLEDVAGRRVVETRLAGRVTVREENAAAALEVMSRFAVDPRWLVYLPPTMSPCETSLEAGLLESPEPAFDHFARQGVREVLCEEKHMGSRAVVVACRTPEAAARRFRVPEGPRGAVFTRTGRPFFSRGEHEEALLDRVVAALEAAGLWDDLATDWVCLDCELMPWSAKAGALLREQYAPVGAAARADLALAASALERAAARVPEAAGLRDRCRERARQAERYGEAWRRYCWPVAGLDDLRLAPFQVLAAEGAVLSDRDHGWHLATLDRLAAADGGLFASTARCRVDTGDPESRRAASSWWDRLVAGGGEGMVVKPLEVVARGPRGLVQPGLKVRGPEYLRIIYGPEYDGPGNLERLRRRGLSAKRSLALREFALGLEALERFVRGEPLHRVHECAFALLALESEPVDPRL